MGFISTSNSPASFPSLLARWSILVLIVLPIHVTAEMLSNSAKLLTIMYSIVMLPRDEDLINKRWQAKGFVSLIFKFVSLKNILFASFIF